MITLESASYFTYVLRSKKNGRLYTGYAHDLRKRLTQHEAGKSYYTKFTGPYDLIYYEACGTMDDAKARELYLKTGMGKRYIKNRLKHFLSLT